MSEDTTVPLRSKLVRCRPEDMVNAIRPWEKEYRALSANLVSSPHFASARLYMIRRIAGEGCYGIAGERLFFYTNNIPGIRVEVPE